MTAIQMLLVWIHFQVSPVPVTLDTVEMELFVQVRMYADYFERLSTAYWYFN